MTTATPNAETKVRDRLASIERTITNCYRTGRWPSDRLLDASAALADALGLYNAGHYSARQLLDVLADHS